MAPQRYPRSVSTRPEVPEAGSGSPGSPPQDRSEARWVESFLLSQSGKTFQTELPEDAHEAASREVLMAAASKLTDEVLRAAEELPEELDRR